LVRNDEHPLTHIVAGERIEHAAKAKYDVAPAFASGGPKVKLAHILSLFAEHRILSLDAMGRHAIQYSELLLAQALVRNNPRQTQEKWPQPAR
jgi:hypothetical protein